MIENKIHTLKIVQPFFDAVASGEKTVELRKDDRGYGEGDILVLREYDPAADTYSGKQVERRVTHIVRGGEWLADGYCAMSIREITPKEIAGIPFYKGRKPVCGIDTRHHAGGVLISYWDGTSEVIQLSAYLADPMPLMSDQGVMTAWREYLAEQSANQTEKFATFVPEIPAGTGPTFVNPADAVIELVADLAELHPAYFECGIRKDELVAEWTEQVKAHKPGETWHPPADCPDNEDYSIEIGEMTEEEYQAQPEFNGY